ncbi:hypothetical protein H2203_000472 [Taxawa tesnikishii (nom. ined.)]|nr:hypothetical protein H2203_000472 [Dothideales sp. JES 119]
MDTWCCRAASNSSSCCGDPSMRLSGTATANFGKFLTTPDSVANSTSDSTPATTVTITATATTTARPLLSDRATVVGAAVGTVLGVALILALLGLLWMMSKHKHVSKEMQTMKGNLYNNAAPVTSGQNSYYQTPNTAAPGHTLELDWGQQRHEMDASLVAKDRPQELL